MNSPTTKPTPRIYFTDFFEVSPKVLADYGAFDVACVADLPLFLDPFLLFASKKPEYQALHQEIIRYLRHVHDRTVKGGNSDELFEARYHFPKVRQTHLDSGQTTANDWVLDVDYLFGDSGKETVTRGMHLEKLVLIRKHIRRENISDCATNLILNHLLEYTQRFALEHLDKSKRRPVTMPKTKYNYAADVWEGAPFELPWFRDDYVLLTPMDLLAKDDLWINQEDLLRDFVAIKNTIPNDTLRNQLDQFFRNARPEKATLKEEKDAMARTVRRFGELADYYIRAKEERGDEALRRSSAKVREVEIQFVKNVRDLAGLVSRETPFYRLSDFTAEAALQKIEFLKEVIENQGGYRFLYLKGKPVEHAAELQLFFKLVWNASTNPVEEENSPAGGKAPWAADDRVPTKFKLAS